MNSRLHCEISAEQINNIAAHLLGDGVSVTEYKLLGGGLFNTTYFIETASPDNASKNPSKKFVVRIAPVNRQFLYPFERDMMRSEPALQRMMHNAGIPTTKIVQYVKAGDVIDREYSISEYIPSLPMNDPSLKDVDLSYIFEDIGAYSKLLHEIKIDGFGWAQPVLDPNAYSYSAVESGDSSMIAHNEFLKAPHKTWYDFLISYANDNIEKMGELEYISRDEASHQLEIIHKHKHFFDKVTESRFTHTDLWQGNVLLQKDGEKFKAAAIIDADRAVFGDREFDFAMGWMCNKDFYKGYEKTGSPYILNDEEKEEAQIKREIYSMLYDFFGVYIFSTQFDQIETSKHYVQRVKEKYERLGK